MDRSAITASPKESAYPHERSRSGLNSRSAMIWAEYSRMMPHTNTMACAVAKKELRIHGYIRQMNFKRTDNLGGTVSVS